MPRNLRLLLPAGFLAVLVAMGCLLSLKRERVSWVAARGPHCISLVHPNSFEVQVLKAPRDTRLIIALHGISGDGSPSRTLGGEHIIEVPPAPGIVRVPFRPPREPAPARFRLIVALSPTGRWADRTEAAESPAMHACSQRKAGLEPTGERSWDLHPLVSSRTFVLEPSNPLRWTLAGLWILAAGIQGTILLRRRPERHAVRRLRMVLIVAFGLTAIWEMTGIGAQLAEGGRGLAQEFQVYRIRGVFQVVLSVLLAALGCGLSVMIGQSKAPMGVRVAFIIVITHTVIAFGALLSFHGFDPIAARAMGGASLLQWIKCAWAAAACIAARTPAFA